jgi:TIR domain
MHLRLSFSHVKGRLSESPIRTDADNCTLVQEESAMSSLLNWGDTAHARLERTIRWGETLLRTACRDEAMQITDSVAQEILDWSESAAFFLNFVSDGAANDQIETLGVDADAQVLVWEIDPVDPRRLRAEMSMRVTLLKKWFDELMTDLASLEKLHFEILGELASNKPAGPVRKVTLQMRLQLENRPFHEALEYLRLQSLLESDPSGQFVELTHAGRNRFAALQASSKMPKKYSPRDLVFFCYARENRDAVAGIHGFVEELGFNTWWDEQNLMGGQDWDYEISVAIEQSAVCLVFLSDESVEKTGYVNKEIKRILDKMDMMPEGKVFMIPIRLDSCALPRRLSKWQVLDYSNEDWQERLSKAIRHAL